MINGNGSSGAVLAVAAAFAVLAPGCLLLLRRRDPMSLMLAIISAAIVTSAAGLLAVITRTPTRPWFVAVVPMVYLLGAVRRGKGPDRGVPAPWLVAGTSVGAIGAAAVPFLYRAPVQWDARSIWFFHASWFAAPRTAYTDLVVVGQFSHPDYPPLTASMGGFSWFFGDNRNDWIPQTATGVVTVAAIGILALLVSGSAVSPHARVLTGIAGAGVAVSVLQGNGFDGYVDGTSAALLTVLVMLAIVDEPDPAAVIVAALAVALVKNEAFVFLVVVVTPLCLLRHLRLAWLVPGIVAGAAWAVAIRLPGPELESWHPSNISPWSVDFGDRLRTIVEAIAADEMLRSTALLWLGSLLLALSSRSDRARRFAGIAGAVGGTLIVVIVGMYLATPSVRVGGLDLHLETSADRLLMHPSLVLGIGAVAAIAQAVFPQLSDPALPAVPDDGPMVVDARS